MLKEETYVRVVSSPSCKVVGYTVNFGFESDITVVDMANVPKISTHCGAFVAFLLQCQVRIWAINQGDVC